MTTALLNKIASFAASESLPVTTIAKREAFKDLMPLLPEMPDDLSEKQLVSLATLYKLVYRPPVKYKHKSKFAWLSSACATEKNDIGRPCLRYVYAARDYLVATDGQKLHCTPTSKTTGYVGFLGNEGQEIDLPYTYLDILRIIPERDETGWWSAKDTKIHIRNGTEYIILNGNVVNRRDFTQACAGQTYVEYSYSPGNLLAPVALYDTFCTGSKALLIPLRIK